VRSDCTRQERFDENPTHTQCGFNYAGDCADYSPVFPSPYACRQYDPAGRSYRGCHAQPGLKTWPHAKTYRQVVTTFVKP
jgi:hypothetical protein